MHFALADLSPFSAAASFRAPSLLYQVCDDAMSRPSDVQAMFDAIPDDQVKELFWIRGATRRWDDRRARGAHRVRRSAHRLAAVPTAFQDLTDHLADRTVGRRLADVDGERMRRHADEGIDVRWFHQGKAPW